MASSCNTTTSTTTITEASCLEIAGSVEHLVKETLWSIAESFFADHPRDDIDFQSTGLTSSSTIDVKPVTSKRSQQLHGDLMVNLGRWNLKQRTWELFTEVLQREINSQAMNDKSTLRNPSFINHVNVTGTRNILYVKLNRMNVFSRTIPKVHQMGNNYGMQATPIATPTGNPTTICTSYVNDGSHGNTGCPSNSIEGLASPDSSVVTSHTHHTLSLQDGRVMLMSGFFNKIMNVSMTTNVNDLITKKCCLDTITSPHFKTVMNSLCDIPLLTVTKETNTSPHITKIFDKESLARLTEYKEDSDDGDRFVVNGEKFIRDKNLSGYHGNIKSIEVKRGGALTMAGKMAVSLQEISKSLLETAKNVKVVMVTSQRNSFLCQQAIIVAQMVLASDLDISFKILEVGPVICPVIATPTSCIEDYVASKMADVRRACETKYGPIENNPTLKVVVSVMSDAAVKFDILGTEPRKTLKLEGARQGLALEDDDARSEGVFVLYNYARLATLLKNYDEGVLRGIYPPLPSSFSKLEYSLLTNEEEWDLMLSYVMTFPSLVEEITNSAESFNSSSSVIMQAAGLKKVCQFLCKMCHAFSGYYSRYKILLGPEPHLLPLIQVRMSLVLAIKQVLFNGLQLLGISPLEQL